MGLSSDRGLGRVAAPGYPAAVPAFLLVGCGYVGQRVARRLLSQGEQVHATSRDPAALGAVAAHGAVTHALDLGDERSLDDLQRLAADLGEGLRVLVAAPPVDAGSSRLHRALGGRPSRVVLLSTTSVYGALSRVDERTAPAPQDEAGRAWLEAERAAAAGPWAALVLRCAAIYGPGRGIHVTLREGRPGRVRDLDRVVSRVHVDDLASLAVAALRSELTGAWPVADAAPATTREVAGFCHRLGLPRLPASPRAPAGAGRRVDGSAIWRLLGVRPEYPSYVVGIPAALAVDGRSEP
ncbi:MAG TPA: hypothetical protein VFE30_15305 [Anaeromyxobacteraceae bacterium]|nr:hypothetical protein [Anaeromyxobacteraceae bacterium]